MAATPNRRIALCLGLVGALVWGSLVPVVAAPAPSKTQPGQSLEARDADLATVRSFLSRGEVASALAERGLTPQEIEQRMAKLSDADLDRLASNLDQVQAAGAMDRDTMWIILYIVLGVLLIVLLV